MGGRLSVGSTGARKPHMGSSRIITTATCQREEAAKALRGSLPSIQSTRSGEFFGGSAPPNGRGPRKNATTLERNSCHGDSQYTPRSRRGKPECTGNASSEF